MTLFDLSKTASSKSSFIFVSLMNDLLLLLILFQFKLFFICKLLELSCDEINPFLKLDPLVLVLELFALF